MKMQTKASLARAMVLYLIITWIVPMLLEMYHLTNQLWIGMVAAVSPLPFVLFIFVINNSLTVKYYTQRAESIALLVAAILAIIARVAITALPSIAVPYLVEIVSFIGLFTSLFSLIRFAHEVWEY